MARPHLADPYLTAARRGALRLQGAVLARTVPPRTAAFLTRTASSSHDAGARITAMPRHTTRRSFLAASAGAGLAAPLVGRSRLGDALFGPAGEPLRILMLGGTGFLGPAIVGVAVERGHRVTLFNRGKTNPGLFPDLEHLHGDRDTADLKALDGREFDVVIDTSAYVPAHVTATASRFATTARDYVLVSSISAYDGFGERRLDIDESSALATVPDDVVAAVKTIRESFRENGRYYGGFKALCEKAAEASMPGKVTVVRPGLIVGPGDNSDRFTWWPVRVARGGEVLAPGDPDAAVQFIDVRDLGAWIVHCVERQFVGVYDAVGFNGRLTMRDLLGGCRCATSAPVEFTWVDDAFLLAHEVGPWMEVPIWMPAENSGMCANDRAIAKGLTFRPVGDTIRDTLAWAKEEAGRRPMFRSTGLAPEKEQAVLAAWHARPESR